jgi:O-antigen/teichoic acid export membrane protein
MFSAFGFLGTNALMAKHLHEFEHKPQERRALSSLTFLITLVGAIATVLVIFFSKEMIYSWKGNSNAYLLKYFWCVPISVFFFIFQIYFEQYSIATHRLTAPSITREILLRGGILLAILAYHFKWLDVGAFFVAVTTCYVISALVNAVYCIAIRNFRITLNLTQIKALPLRYYGKYSLFVFLITAFAAVVLNVDQPLVYGMLGAQSVDIYGNAVTLAAMVTIPYKPLSNILLPFMYEAWHKQDYQKLNQINQESSVNLTLVGTVMCVLLLANTHNLMPFLPPLYHNTLFAPLAILAIGRVLDFTTGASTELVLSAPSYKMLALFMFLSMVFSFVAYFALVPSYKAIGAAIVVSVNLLFYNALKYYHLYKTYGLQPLHKNSFVAILIGVVIFASQLLVPKMYWLADVIVRSTLITLAFAIAVYKLQLVPFFNLTIQKYLGKS